MALRKIMQKSVTEALDRLEEIDQTFIGLRKKFPVIWEAMPAVRELQREYESLTAFVASLVPLDDDGTRARPQG